MQNKTNRELHPTTFAVYVKIYTVSGAFLGDCMPRISLHQFINLQEQCVTAILLFHVELKAE